MLALSIVNLGIVYTTILCVPGKTAPGRIFSFFKGNIAWNFVCSLQICVTSSLVTNLEILIAGEDYLKHPRTKTLRKQLSMKQVIYRSNPSRREDCKYCWNTCKYIENVRDR